MKRWIVLSALAFSALLAASCGPDKTTEGTKTKQPDGEVGLTPETPQGEAYTIRYNPGDTHESRYDMSLSLAHAESDSKITIEGEQITTSKKDGDSFMIEERMSVSKSNLTGSYFKADGLERFKTRLNTPVRMTTDALMHTELDEASAAYLNITKPGSDFPESPVRVGDSWQATIEMKNTGEQKIPAKFAAVEELDGRESLKLEYGPMPVEGGTTDGPMTIWIDPETGIVLKVHVKIDHGSGLTSELMKTIK